MRVPFTWLKDFVDIDLSAGALAELLTNSGLEVEEIEEYKPGFSGVIVVEVLAVNKHPEADKLFVVRVSDGLEVHTIVAGINNMGTGDKVPLAKPGALLPGGMKIGRAKLRGVESAGMLCSAAELDLPLNPGVDGILVLDRDTPVGAPLEEAINLCDPVLILGLTPNRADCLGLIGVAFEVAALTGARVQMPDTALRREEPQLPRPNITIENTDLCPRYAGLVVREIRAGLSPVWLQVRLLQAGVRAISNIVDVTNYVMWEWGQPLHAFDYDTLAEHSIVVRTARPGETLLTLDDSRRQLTENMLLIADAHQAVGLAGVMGGQDTEVSDKTCAVLLEAAHFNSVSIRRTGRSLGLYSEAQQRFEKGVDINGCADAVRRAARLIEFLGAGRTDGDVVDVYPSVRRPKSIRLRPKRARGLIGLEISQMEMTAIFLRQGFAVEEGTQLHVTVPTRRPDLENEVDLIEEIARIHGYDKIATTLPYGPMTQGRRTVKQQALDKVRRIMQSCGLTEAINYSFISPQALKKLLIPTDHPLSRMIPVANPLSEEQSVMRTQLLSGLLSAASHNLNRNEANLKMFEIGPVYLPKALPVTELPVERTALGLILTGEAPAEHWRHKPVPVDFFDVKGIIETLFIYLGIRGEHFEEAVLPWCQPGQTACIYIQGEAAGWLGCIHPETAEAYGLKKNVYAAELNLDLALDRLQLVPEYHSLPRYPAMLRDMAVEVPDTVSAGEVISLIRKTGGQLVEDVRIFDLYRGRQITENHRSLGFAVTYRDPARTLSDDVAAGLHEKIQQALADHYGASLRKI